MPFPQGGGMREWLLFYLRKRTFCRILFPPFLFWWWVFYPIETGYEEWFFTEVTSVKAGVSLFGFSHGVHPEKV
ncbi:MAG: hypothetical protein ABDK92_10415 [Atribacterota bacterium]